MKLGITSERNVEDLTSQKITSISYTIKLQQRLLGSSKSLSNRLNRAPRFHHVSIMDNLGPIHLVTATRQRNPQLIPNINHLRVLYAVNGRDLLGSYQSRENVSCYMFEAVSVFNSVSRDPVGDASSVRAYTTKRDLDRLLRVYSLVGWSRGREVVCPEKSVEVFDPKSGFDDGKCSCVGNHVVHQALTLSVTSTAVEG